MIQQVPWRKPESAQRIKVAPGDVYEFKINVTCRDGSIHPTGSRLFVHDSTTETPFDEVGPNGINWYCRTQFSLSIWSTLESCIERGLLRKVAA